MRDYLVGLAIVLGGLLALATLPFWLPVLFIGALFTVVPYKIGRAVRGATVSESPNVHCEDESCIYCNQEIEDELRRLGAIGKSEK